VHVLEQRHVLGVTWTSMPRPLTSRVRPRILTDPGEYEVARAVVGGLAVSTSKVVEPAVTPPRRVNVRSSRREHETALGPRDVRAPLPSARKKVIWGSRTTISSCLSKYWHPAPDLPERPSLLPP